MIWESVLVFVFVLGSLKGLFELRYIPFIKQYLTTFSAIILIYAPLFHIKYGKLPITFFETSLSHFVRSLFTFIITALVIFPLFLIGNHYYQRLLGHVLVPSRFEWSGNAWITQLFLIALPEEFFFRGYLQTLLSARITRKFRFLGIPALEMSWAVPLTSFIFALSHTFITFRWWHFAIFFPSLAFGWLREKTGGLVAPILFHATSNILVMWIGMVYR